MRDGKGIRAKVLTFAVAVKSTFPEVSRSTDAVIKSRDEPTRAFGFDVAASRVEGFAGVQIVAQIVAALRRQCCVPFCFVRIWSMEKKSKSS